MLCMIPSMRFFSRLLRKLAGWISIPDNSTLGRLFRTFRERQVSQLETLNHRLRGKVWRRALRSGDAYTSNGVVEFTKQLLAHLPKNQTILFRGFRNISKSSR